MSSPQLDELARRYGIARVLDGFAGRQAVSDETTVRILASLGIAADSDAAIAASLVQAEGLEPPTLRAAAGKRCYLPEWLENGKAWGISLQLYELRSRRNWGIGDFADLAEFCRIAARAGADFVGINPLHALFVSDANRCSPFSPSNRLFLNPLYIAVDHVPGYEPSQSDNDAAEKLRNCELVDYAGVANLKIGALRRVWQCWRQDAEQRPSPFSAEDFREFRKHSGEALWRHALFEAISAAMVARNGSSGWKGWPEQFRSVDSPSVQAFAEASEDEILFHAWLQWIARTQLAQGAATARRAGLRIGLYLDFAVGETPDGSASWSDPSLSVPGMSIGAPPDMFTAEGQDWGLAPTSPLAMTRTDFSLCRQMNDTLMRHAGALRVDHAMSLWQLFFVPEGGRPDQGAYVRYPVERLLALLAEQSQQHRTIVIGEDLGHVPPGFREVMRETTILSYRILYFEKQDEDFIAAGAYPRLALACLSTHDLPTLNGWWRGDDIDLRLEHGFIDEAAAATQRSARTSERDAIIRSMLDTGALPEYDFPVVQAAASNPAAPLPAALVVAAHRFVAKTPCVLAGVRLADLTGERRPTNLPGTTDSYPNWRLKSSVALEDLPDSALFRAITEAVATERPRAQ
ncbi:4-alpha-glucanotransferase [Pseudaminobacter sp. NGMCC 1.201702]|uniref:4-alpha-glucanotransferase n=1 Tax=Pseudaminobacter sp. NGMCC 1.201702 TaxID=3391825 RepID=UPI0039EEB3F7